MPEEEKFNNQISDEAKASLQELTNDINDNDSLLRRQMRAAGIYRPRDMDYKENFYRIRRIDPYYLIDGGTYEYLFFTKPDMNILDSDGQLNTQIFKQTNIYGVAGDKFSAGTAASTYLQDLITNNYRPLLTNLCASYTTSPGDACPFVRILSNRKISNLDLPDLTVPELETGQNLYGTKLYYPTTSRKSDEDAEFSVEFEDTQFLEVYHFFKAYDTYRRLKWAGLIMPYQEHIDNRILGDHMSIYKFVVDNDGETILYYAKATGVYPKSISRSAFSEVQDKGQVKVTVNFKLSGWVEDMDPVILADFNRLVAKWILQSEEPQSVTSFRGDISPIYDNEIAAVSGESLRYFYVDHEFPENDEINKDGYGRYYLVGCK